jgi:hypothetical protein
MSKDIGPGGGRVMGPALWAVLSCYVDERTLKALEARSRESGRSVEELAEAAIADAAIRSEPPSDRRPS